MSHIIIRKYVDTVEQAAYRGLEGVAVSIISDSCDTSIVMDAGIKPMHSSFRLLGTALTVKLGRNSNLLLHKALSLSQPGDVLVVDNGGDCSAAVFGELMSTVATCKKLAGIVVDGLVRDTDKFGEIGFPVFARGALPRVVGHEPTAGSINLPVMCGAVTVEPGDVIAGDEDGLIVLKPADLSGIVERAHQKLAGEQKRLTEIAAGKHSPAWLDSILQDAAVLYID